MTALAAGIATVVTVAACAAPAAAQPSAGNVSRMTRPVLRGEVLRQIDDPAAHGTWLLVRDPVHRAGPGRLIWVPNGAAPREAVSSAADEAPRNPLQPVILAGDQLVVEEETPVVDARLEATALNPAPAGASLHVRLQIGGKVVRAIAVGPGLARLAPELEIEP
jgi:hypothetical protein